MCLGATAHPTAEWITRQLMEAYGWGNSAGCSRRTNSAAAFLAITRLAARDHLSPQAAIATKSRRRLCRLHGRADRGELIGGQRLLREQQSGAFFKIGTARAQDVGRLA